VKKIAVDGTEYEIEGILFDKDGTLIKLDVLWSSWFDELWEKITNVNPSTKLTKGSIAKSVGLDLTNRSISTKGPLAIGTLEDITIILSFHLYCDGIPWNDAVSIVRKSIEDIHRTIDWESSLQLICQLEPFLKRAKAEGIKLSVVTSDDTDIAKLHLQLLKIDHYFDSIIGSEDVSRPKPFPDIGIQACEEMGINTNTVIVIGDTNADMNLGKNLQAKASIGIVHENKDSGDYLTSANHIINHYGQIAVVPNSKKMIEIK